MANRVFINSQHILEITVDGDQTADSVIAMGHDIGRLVTQLRNAGRPVLVLDDLKRLGETTPEARREVARLAKTLAYDRLAMVGDSRPIMRHGTNLMLRAIGRPQARYFASRDAAYLWLGIEASGGMQ